MIPIFQCQLREFFHPPKNWTKISQSGSAGRAILRPLPHGWLFCGATATAPSQIVGWVKTYDYHIWKNQHPLTSYFRYHPGARVLTHNHMHIEHPALVELFSLGNHRVFSSWRIIPWGSAQKIHNHSCNPLINGITPIIGITILVINEYSTYKIL